MKYNDNGVWKELNVKVSDTLPVGTIIPYAGTTIPSNYMKCEGQELSRIEYDILFSAIGTTYGAGDGSTTFNLPNLKGRVITGIDSNDTDFDTLGEKGGEKEHTLTVDEMPSHRHDFEKNGAWGASGTHTGNLNENGENVYDVPKTKYAGGSQAHNIMQPYIALNYIIKVLDAPATGIHGGKFLSFTPTIKDATMTYSTRYGKYRYINDSTIMGTVVLRGNITAISSPAYARIKFNIPNVTSSNLQGWESFGTIQEASGCTDVTPYCAVVGADGEDITIGLQRNGGTAVTNWVVANDIYIRVAFIINLEN